MALFGGIDGGGSKTLAVIVNEKGEEVGRGQAADANYQVLMVAGHTDKEAAKLAAARIAEAVALAVPERAEPLTAIYAGLAGVDRPTDAALLTAALSELNLCPAHAWQVTNDAELILYGLALTNGVGLGLIAGTGSIALGRDYSGKKARAGGWGYLFGDEGSGFDLGRAALQAAAQAADRRGPSTTLLARILTEWQLTKAEDLITSVYSQVEGRNQRIAKLARLVFEATREGDVIAGELAKKAALDLAAAVWAVYKQLDFEREHDEIAPPALGLGGGLLLNTPELKQTMLDRLAKVAFEPRAVVEVRDPAKAAALACREASLRTKNEG